MCVRYMRTKCLSQKVALSAPKKINHRKSTISKKQWNYLDKIPRPIKKFKKTDTFQLFTKHRIAG